MSLNCCRSAARVGLRSWAAGTPTNGTLARYRGSPARSMSIFHQMKEPEEKSFFYRNLDWLKVKLSYQAPEKIVLAPKFNNQGNPLPMSLRFKTVYGVKMRDVMRTKRKSSMVRKIRVKKYRYMRRRLRREVKKIFAERRASFRKDRVDERTPEEMELAPMADISQISTAKKQKWIPRGFYSMPKIPGTLQPLAPLDYDPTAPPLVMRKPITNGIRHQKLIDRSALYKGRALKSLTVFQKRKSGRCAKTGRIVLRGRGGGYRHRYRIVDFRRDNHADMEGVIERIEYDPNRSSFICLVKHSVPEGKFLPLANTAEPYSYIICPQGVRVGEKVMASKYHKLDPKPGNSMQIGFLPPGTKVHCLQLKPDGESVAIRSAGTGGDLISKNDSTRLVVVRMPSKEVRLVPYSCICSVGKVSNPNHGGQVLGKAGRRRNKGFRPRVRGVAMNPVDHPHGGGEGKSSGGRPSVSRWGWLCKGGQKTRKKSRDNSMILTSRHAAKR